MSLYVVQGFNYLAPIIVLPYLLRVLGPRGYGAIAFSQAVIAYARIWTDFGFNLSSAKNISVARDDPREVDRVFWSTIFAKIGLFLVGAVTIIPIVYMVPTLHRHMRLIFISGLSVMGSVILPQWYFQGLERMRLMGLALALSRVASLVAIFFVVHSAADVFPAAALLALPTLLGGVLCLAILPLVRPVRWYRPTLKDIKTTVADSWYLFVSAAATSLYLNSNVFLLGMICGDYQVALYSAANKIALAVFGMLSPIAQAVFPRANIIFQKSVDDGKEFARKLVRYTLGISGILAVLMFMFARKILTIFGGTSYVEATSVLRVMSVLPLLLTLATIMSQIVMINIGMTRELSRIYLVAGAISIILLIPLAAAYGAIGGALSLVVVESVGPVMMYRAIVKFQSIR